MSPLEGKPNLCSAPTYALPVPPTHQKTKDARGFPVFAPRAWNGILSVGKSTSNQQVFKKNLKTFLFHRWVLALPQGTKQRNECAENAYRASYVLLVCLSDTLYARIVERQERCQTERLSEQNVTDDQKGSSTRYPSTK